MSQCYCECTDGDPKACRGWSGWQDEPPCRCMCHEKAEDIAAQVVRNVCELPDYSSPDAQPDLVMCKVDELHLCVMRALGQDV
jgi:hypothetical protein